MSQSLKTFTHPAVARARKEAAQECAQIAAEVSNAGGSAERVRELIVERFELAIPDAKHAEDASEPYARALALTWPPPKPKDK